MIEIICSRSGLTFEAPNRRRKVHPGISVYTSHKDMDYRYAAIAVIERGKAEGWDSLEKFEKEIAIATDPEAATKAVQEISDVGLCKVELKRAKRYPERSPWVARITGTSTKFGFERKFITPVLEQKHLSTFLLEDGFYEECEFNSKGEKQRRFLCVQNGEKEYLSKQELTERTGWADGLIEKRAQQAREKAEAEAKEAEAKQGAIVVKNGEIPVTSVNGVVDYNGVPHFVAWRDEKCQWLDEDGITWDQYPSSVRVEDEWSIYTYWLKPATAEQIEAHYQKQQAEERKQEEIKAAAQTMRTIKSLAYPDHREKPEEAHPSGTKIGYKFKRLRYDSPYVQIDEAVGVLWSIKYNFRDGDDWRYNNFGGHSVAQCQPLTPQLRQTLEEYIAVIERVYPEAIER